MIRLLIFIGLFCGLLWFIHACWDNIWNWLMKELE